MGNEKEHAEIEPVEDMPLAAEDHGLTAGSENEDIAVPEGAGAPAEAMVPPAAESAESLPPIREEDNLTPTPTQGSTAPVPGEVLQPDAEMVAKFITDDRLNTLWKRADKVKLEVDEKVHTLDIARALLDQIMYARNYLLAGRHFFEEAERHVNEVEFRVLTKLQIAEMVDLIWRANLDLRDPDRSRSGAAVLLLGHICLRELQRRSGGHAGSDDLGRVRRCCRRLVGADQTHLPGAGF